MKKESILEKETIYINYYTAARKQVIGTKELKNKIN